MAKCKEAFEKWHGFTVCEEMDIQTSCAWDNWCDAWNTAIREAASMCNRLAIDGKRISGPVDRAMGMARDEVLTLEHRAAALPHNVELTGSHAKE